MSEQEKPLAAKKGPYVMTVQPGRYWWCACGRTSSEPFCDKSHKGTEFSPIKVEISEEKEIAWCGCRQSASKPYCDGTHSKG